ncbi:beta-ketoacyl synthase N-terminal-like domain-containing protein [Aquisalimonas sp. APHAB1-3]|uniref:beta-ketoacyl synthase N-terminal-like domain-containing protein n=2 Tax=unclassified Aquisalimonas TaxID=2644645 RepID=UPI003AB01978
MTAPSRHIAVTGAGVECATGDRPGALLGALLAGVRAVRPRDELAQTDPVTRELAAPVLAPVDPEAAIGHVDADTVGNMLVAAIQRAMEGADTAVDRVLLVLPASDAACARRLPQHAVVKRVAAAQPWMHDVVLECTTHREAPAALAALWQALAEGRCRCALVAGVDSLANLESLTEAQRAGHVRTTEFPDGWALGEAAACVRLEQDTRGAAEIRMHQPVAGHEPHHGAVGRNHLQGLGAAAGEALDAAGLTGGKPDAVILARAQESLAELEWYHAHSGLWPQRLPARQQLAMRRGELEAPQPDPEPPVETLRPALTLGETGAAGLPVALALAHARFQLDLMPVRHCLVLDATAGPERLAVCLSTQQTSH